jgi:DNA-directed RNA polymerase specialized sigma24 family protein
MGFPLTNWDILQLLRTGDEKQRAGMLGEIVTLYGPSLFALARHESQPALSRQDCEDVVGDFFLKCVQDDVIQQADRAKGRFRNFLARSFKNFMLNWIRDRAAQVRAPSGGMVSLHTLVDRHGRALEPLAGESGEEILDRVFRLSLFECALTAFEQVCVSSGQEKKFRVYVRREIAPERDGVDVPSYSALAAEFGFPSEDAVGRAVRAARDEFRLLLLALIKKDAVSANDAEAEFKLTLAAGLQPWRSPSTSTRSSWFSRLTDIVSGR